MFTLSKLRELSPKTRMRKVARILQAIEVEAAAGHEPDPVYLQSLVQLLIQAPPPGAGDILRDLGGALSRGGTPEAVLRGTNSLRHAILSALNAEPAEWDLVSSSTGLLDRSGLRLYPFTIYLEDIRSPFNVGSIFRTAEAFGAERIILSPRTPAPTHPRAEKTALGTTHALPWSVAPLDSLEGSEQVFALELGGVPLSEFIFPRKGTVLVGSEELGLSPEALSLADRGLGRVSIPLAGAKRSLNVSVAFGILMQAWLSSASRGVGL
jgi:TrmH family RNA methyltransferase